ncbi:MAG: hypothetical protein RSC17_04175, partial [Lachnospiraceae bacterium]
MNNFWSLVGFEYKKIFVRKSVLIAVLLALIATIFSVFTLVMGINPNTGISNYKEMLIDKEYSLAFSGTPLDKRLILKASKAYQTIPDGVYPYSDSVEYEKYARPYNSVYTLIDSTYAECGNGFDTNDLQEISEEDANSFYEKRINQYRINLENNSNFTKGNVDRIIEADNQIKKPFIMEYTDGYERFFSFSTTNAFIVMFLIAFILSPMFVNEYSQRTDSLILTSKNGKTSQIYAKIFTGVSFSIAISTFFLLIGYFLCMCVYGFDGANSPIQLHIPLLTYNFTMIEVAMILFATTIFGGFLMTAICFYLSSAMNNSIVVLAVSVTVVLLGMFNGIFP